MSTSILPSYHPAEPLDRTPSYSYEPHDYEQRVALADRPLAPPSGSFVKQSKNGNSCLRLLAQENDAVLPIYGASAVVDGFVELSKTEGVSRVEVKVKDLYSLESSCTIYPNMRILV